MDSTHECVERLRGPCQLLDKIPNSRSNGVMTKHDQDRKTRILQAIAEGSRRSGTPPTVREIAELVGLAAPSAVHHHLETLEREGLIQRDSGLSRSVRLTARGRSLLELDDAVETTNLPMAARELVVVGQIAAGGPIEAYEERSESVAVPEFMSTADSYLLKIRGDSMIDAQIADGDYVLRVGRLDLAERHRPAHADVGLAVAEFLEALFQQRHQIAAGDRQRRRAMPGRRQARDDRVVGPCDHGILRLH